MESLIAATRRCPERSGRPLPEGEARHQATNGSDAAKGGEPRSADRPGSRFAVGGRAMALESRGDSSFHRLVIPGRILFAVPMAIFGAQHFLIPAAVQSLLPKWMPWHAFWAYSAGTCLIAAAVAISAGRFLRLAATLLAVLLLSFVVIVSGTNLVLSHGARLEWILALRDLGLSGAAMLLAGLAARSGSPPFAGSLPLPPQRTSALGAPEEMVAWRRASLAGNAAGVPQAACGLGPNGCPPRSGHLRVAAPGAADARRGGTESPNRPLIDEGPRSWHGAGRWLLAVAIVFFGVESLWSPRGWPGIPEAPQALPAWIPAHLALSIATGIVLLLAGLAILWQKREAMAAAVLGWWFVALAVLVILPIAIGDPAQRVLAINTVAMYACYGGAMFLLAAWTGAAYRVPASSAGASS